MPVAPRFGVQWCDYTSAARALVAELYPWSLVWRLLQDLPALSEGHWPPDSNAQPGYRGKHATEGAPWEQAVIAYVDVMAAIGRLPEPLRGQVWRRCWAGERRALRYNVAVDMVWREVNQAPTR